ncbi:hypothetical protein [Gillisia limnaea]|uniref:Uncharacterized protein n=1 Tax=Gillisia limnaea (strain DSM 15749 / LMG 21470 / R-8282) TaxID=865937 RepID=H2BRH4_GILLR|nr:hypothetical protein [Gillisia limnaea]EHQ04493.1 hypothetical protein Gilli_0345 [Gillisia limnaea DSM 15749]
MATMSFSQKSANEKDVEELENDTLNWDKTLQTLTDELLFLKHLLASEVFQPINPDTSEKVKSYTEDLEDLKTEKIEVQLALRNHKNDLNGMLECEDISCEIFYKTQHQELLNSLKELLANFKDLKLKIFNFSIPFLKKN